MKIGLFILATFTFLSSILANGVTPTKEWTDFVESNKANRQKIDSEIYLDTYLRMYKANPFYIYRSAKNTVNKIERSAIQVITDSLQGIYALGFVEADNSVKSGYSYVQPNGSKIELVEDQLIKIDAQNFSLRLTNDGDGYAVEVFNYSRPYAELLRKPEFFPYNPSWVVMATFEAIEGSESIAVPTSDGGFRNETRYGWVHFQFNEKDYKVPVYGYSSYESQIRFTDESPDVYPGGRYLYVKDEDLLSGRSFTLDFNMAMDPPCAYSQTYNCSLPARDEHLSVVVNAGRKDALRNVH